jgi:hypothetical protein
MIIQPIGTEEALTTDTTLDEARYVSCLNTTAGVLTIAIKNPDGVLDASVTIAGGERFTLVKFYLNTISAPAGIRVVKLVRTQ